MPTNKKSTKGKSKGPELDRNGRPAKIKRVKEVVFDQESRKDYLTGFSKRKKAKQNEKVKRAVERERDELRKMRAQIREQRKEQAAHNVRVAAEMYGDAGAEGEAGSDEDVDFGDSASDSDDDNEEGATEEPTSYETTDALTTVEIAPLSLSRSPTPEPLVDIEQRVLQNQGHVPGPSQTAMSSHKKRVRGTSQARPKLSREDKKERAKSGKGGKKKLEGRMKGTKARSAR
ncbi:rRNA-processing protein RRP17 [Sporobolomyces koalae]|uniref:rRNA-processing protein RRP17 n=1 Tax=Sporobolomyces koalae TaxID=500713 RepID=UPI003173870A